MMQSRLLVIHQTANDRYSTLFGVNNYSHTNTYLVIIFDVDISSFFNKVFYYVNAVSSFNCHMQGGHLMKRKKAKAKYATSRKVSVQTVCTYF